jgi:hypothetical protein
MRILLMCPDSNPGNWVMPRILTVTRSILRLSRHKEIPLPTYMNRPKGIWVIPRILTQSTLRLNSRKKVLLPIHMNRLRGIWVISHIQTPLAFKTSYITKI